MKLLARGFAVSALLVLAPAAQAEILYLAGTNLTGQSIVAAIDPSTLDLVGSFTTPRTATGLAALSPSALYASFSNGVVSNYQPTTGALINSAADAGFHWTGIAAGGGLVYTVGINADGRAGLVGNDPTTLDLTAPDFFTALRATGIVYKNGSIFATFSDGTISEFKASSGDLIKSAANSGFDWTAIAAGGGSLYVAGLNPQGGAGFAGGDPTTLDLTAPVASTALTASGIVYAGGSIFASFADGTISDFDASSGALIATIQDVGYSWTAITAAGAGLAVPEPSTWTAALVGFLTLAAYGRRHRRRGAVLGV